MVRSIAITAAFCGMIADDICKRMAPLPSSSITFVGLAVAEPVPMPDHISVGRDCREPQQQCGALDLKAPHGPAPLVNGENWAYSRRVSSRSREESASDGRRDNYYE